MAIASPTVGLQVQPLNVASSDYNPQAATAAMIEAFRNGQITTADIIERSTKMPALRQQVAEATDPALIAARRTAVIENAAQQQTATLKAKLDLEREGQLAKIPAEAKAKIAELGKANFFPPNVSLASWDANDEAAVNAAHATLKEWEGEQASVSTFNKSIKDGTTNVGGVAVAVSKTPANKVADATAVDYNSAWEVSFGTPGAWVAAGKPRGWKEFYKGPPGTDTLTTGADGKPTVARVPESASTPEAVKALTVERRVAAPSGQTPTITLGSLEPGSALVGEAPKEPASKQNTEKQTSAQFFATRAQQTNSILAGLEKKGFDPASVSTYLQGYLVGPARILKEQDVKKYESAKEAWVQGLLRMESGAAISQKEQRWYEDTFFPVVGDDAEVQAQKTALRKAMERTSLMVAANDPLGEKALMEYGIRSDENYKLYTSGKVEGTPEFDKKNGASTKPVKLDGKPTHYLQRGADFFVPSAPEETAGQKPKSAAPLQVAPNTPKR